MLIETDVVTRRTVTGRVANPDDTPPDDPVVIELLDSIRETSSKRTILPSAVALYAAQWTVELPVGAEYRVQLDGQTKTLALAAGGPLSVSDWMA